MLPGGNHSSPSSLSSRQTRPTLLRGGGWLPKVGYLYSSPLCCVALVSLGEAQAGSTALLGPVRGWGGCETLQEFVVKIMFLWGITDDYTQKQRGSGLSWAREASGHPAMWPRLQPSRVLLPAGQGAGERGRGRERKVCLHPRLLRETVLNLHPHPHTQHLRRARASGPKDPAQSGEQDMAMVRPWA